MSRDGGLPDLVREDTYEGERCLYIGKVRVMTQICNGDMSSVGMTWAELRAVVKEATKVGWNLHVRRMREMDAERQKEIE